MKVLNSDTARVVRRCLTLILWLLGPSLQAQDLRALLKDARAFTLENGLRVIVVRRGNAPVFSYCAIVDTGSADDPPGLTGLAHMMEHMAFKGTDKIGSKDWRVESARLTRVEQLEAEYLHDQEQQVRDERGLSEVKRALENAISDADKYGDADDMNEVLERAGARGMNAVTSADETAYFYSLPSSSLKLWAQIEAQRLARPVMRNFYHERDVVREERRLRIESRPLALLLEDLLAKAYAQSPYGRPGIGRDADIDHLTGAVAQQFFQAHYLPSNMVIAVVGDVDVYTVRSVMKKYFGQLPSGRSASVNRDIPHFFGGTVVKRQVSGPPIYIEAYGRPEGRDESDPAFAVLANVLFDGQVAPFTADSVIRRRVATVASGFDGIPGKKFPSLFGFYVIASSGHSIEDLQTAVRSQIERLTHEDISENELRAAKSRIQLRMAREINSDSGLARQLASYEIRYGDWRSLGEWMDRVNGVNSADVRRLAIATFTDANRIVAIDEKTTERK